MPQNIKSILLWTGSLLLLLLTPLIHLLWIIPLCIGAFILTCVSIIYLRSKRILRPSIGPHTDLKDADVVDVR